MLLVSIGADAGAREAVVGMNERVFRIVENAQLALDAEQPDEALAILAEADRRPLSAYEEAQVRRMQGLAHYHAGRLPEATDAYGAALAVERLPDSMRGSLLGSLARLYLMADRDAEAELLLRELLLIDKYDNAETRVLLASALIRQERFDAALEPLLSAIETARSAGDQPRENWLSMLSGVYYALEDLEAMREVLRELSERYPREQYLMSLAALHGQLDDRERQLALLEALLEEERLRRPEHLKMVAGLFLAENVPVKAAQLLEAALADGRLEADRETLEQLSQAWYLAAEFDAAIEPLEAAAALADDGSLYVRLAGLHMDAYRWQAADAAASQALELGGLEKEGRAWLLRGMANAQQRRFDAAEEYFDAARRFEETRAHADQWLLYVAGERRAALAAAPSS